MNINSKKCLIILAQMTFFHIVLHHYPGNHKSFKIDMKNVCFDKTICLITFSQSFH